MQRIKLVYILSNGRSGSTLLDLLLGSHPSFWTTGEVHLLPWELIQPKRPCGCGEPVHLCEFWREVLGHSDLRIRSSPVGNFRNSKHVGKVVRWSLLPDLAFREFPTSRQRVYKYGEANRSLFAAILRQARLKKGGQVEWLIDASKDVYRLEWLRRAECFDLRVVHLLKDPRAFVFSMNKERIRRGSRLTGKAIRYTGRWIVENALGHMVVRKIDPKDRYVLRYEDLASKPDATVRALGEWLDLDLKLTDLKDFRSVDNHAISGNRMRWESSSIQLDERWKDELPQKHARWIRAVAAPAGRLMGFRIAR